MNSRGRRGDFHNRGRRGDFHNGGRLRGGRRGWSLSSQSSVQGFSGFRSVSSSPNPRFSSSERPIRPQGENSLFSTYSAQESLNNSIGRGNFRGRHNGRPRNQDGGKYERKYAIGIKTLEEILEKEPYIIAVELMKKNSGYDILLNEPEIKMYKVGLVIKLLHKSFHSRANEEGTCILLQTTFESQPFLQNLMRYVSEVKLDRPKALEYLPLLCEIMQYFLRSTPMSSFLTISSVTDMCLGAIVYLKGADPSSIQELEQSFANLSLLIQECRVKFERSEETKPRQKLRIFSSEDPTDDFRDLGIIPSLEDLKTTEHPFVRPHIVKGPYKGHDHYLDVLFRLLREDFLQPLRKGFQNYLYETEPFSRNHDVRVYSNVKFDSSDVKGTEVTYYLKLTFKKNFKIENSKRFMFGNILCISSDNFQTMAVASVCSRDKLKSHLIGVQLETNSYQFVKNKSYVLLESKAYFIAYSHTLRALQKVREVPLKDNIIDVEKKVHPPAYIARRASYSIPVISSSIVTRSIEVPVLFPLELWPSCDEFNLDESQLRAFHGALTRQMAIIQGPPGTGKTFLGLYITRTLIKNKEHWKKDENRPILVVCYTNHALDQFLEGILTFTKNIVRVGSMSKNEALMEYQIGMLLKSRNTLSHRNSQKNAISRNLYQVRSQCMEVKKEIDFVNNILNNNDPGILDMKTFMVNKIQIPNHLENYFRYYSLEHFLLDSFLFENRNNTGEAMSGGLVELPQMQSCSAMDEEENNDSELDDEILQEEERDRILVDMEFEDLKAPSYVPSGRHCRYETSCQFIKKLLQEHEVKVKLAEEGEIDIDVTENINDIRILEAKYKALTSAEAINWTEGECTVLEVSPIEDLSISDRWKLYFYWRSKLFKELTAEKRKLEVKFNTLSKNLQSLRDLEYIGLMKSADVVGMTTTGAARYCNLLHDLSPPIVIVEEAAEIMEAHVISSLSERCQHLILIGDHLQLRPKPAVYELGVKYHLDVSLFERMVRNGVQYETLEYQHRMKPVISDLLVPTIYENLKDHKSVMRYPKIEGVNPDLFFLDHEELENHDNDDSETFENKHEALFLMGLCRHLVFQGYSCDDITIITPYSGQHRCLRKLQKENRFHVCNGVRISILDNYQGEENVIILLSLVRSNREEKVGFVKTDNRICVALSRAKHGMYIIGNMTQMAKASGLWSQIKEKLLKGGNIGPQLRLSCRNHPLELITVKSYEDFVANSPEGGCKRPCLETFPQCGHKCPRSCHIINMDHSTLNCIAPCPKILCKLGHQCPRLCFEMCKPCLVLVEKTLPCSHTHPVPCSTNPEEFSCPTKVEKILPHCGHYVTMRCYQDPSTYKCPFPCTTRLDCGHQCKWPCHPLKDPAHDNYVCIQMCERNPENCEFNHKCFKRCHEDCGRCSVIINRRLECGHTMDKVPCGILMKDLECQRPCTRTLECNHRCPRACGEPCGGCKKLQEKTIPECQHTVKVICSEQPTLKHCYKRCVKILPCSHQCQNKCREPCTFKCREFVPSTKLCPRNHAISLKCYKSQPNYIIPTISTILEGHTLGEQCNKSCGMRLECDHICLGKCGKCLNGRLHSSCLSKCEKTLVCGHLCKSPCSEDCPPCQDNCFWKCTHSMCKKKCGEPCNLCQEKCDRKCKHTECNKKCGEKCDRKPCQEACSEFLKCGHPCIGYCGEPCPPLCRICDQDKVSEILFGNEDEEDARFVLLVDCGHVIEGEGLEGWLQTALEPKEGGESIEIGMKKCPLCNKPIYNTRRFQNEILMSYKNVQQVKNRHFETKTKPSFRDDDFKRRLQAISRNFPEAIRTLASNVGFDVNFMKKRKNKQFSKLQEILYSFQMDFLEKAKPLSEKLGEKDARLKELVSFVMGHSESISHQTRDEVSCELRRLEVCFSVQNLRMKRDYKTESFIHKIDSLMDPTIKFDANLEDKVKRLLKDAERLVGSLGISDVERIQILRAMGLSQGHWYKCPNGHIYCIDACGGAMEVSTCPECKSVIGGTQHRLRADNKLATEMDGATISAWPGGPHGNYLG